MKQREINLVGEAQAAPLLLCDEKLVRQCRDGSMALRQTIANTGLSQEDLAKSIGKAKKVLSRALNGSCGLPIDSLIKLMNESESVYLLQYMCEKMGGTFRFLTNEEKQSSKSEDGSMKHTHAFTLLEAFKKGQVMTAYDAPIPNFSQRLCDLESIGYHFGRCAVDGKRYFKYWLIQEKKAA